MYSTRPLKDCLWDLKASKKPAKENTKLRTSRRRDDGGNATAAAAVLTLLDSRNDGRSRSSSSDRRTPASSGGDSDARGRRAGCEGTEGHYEQLKGGGGGGGRGERERNGSGAERVRRSTFFSPFAASVHFSTHKTGGAKVREAPYSELCARACTLLRLLIVA